MFSLTPSEFFSAMSSSEREAYRRAYLAEFRTDKELAAIEQDFQNAYAAFCETGARGNWTEPAGIRCRRLDRQREIERSVLESFMEAAEASMAA